MASEAELLAEWMPISDASVDEDFIVGGFFRDDLSIYDKPRIVRPREKDWPRRVEFYEGMQRVFPTHFLRLPPPPARAATMGGSDG